MGNRFARYLSLFSGTNTRAHQFAAKFEWNKIVDTTYTITCIQLYLFRRFSPQTLFISLFARVTTGCVCVCDCLFVSVYVCMCVCACALANSAHAQMAFSTVWKSMNVTYTLGLGCLYYIPVETLWTDSAVRDEQNYLRTEIFIFRFYATAWVVRTKRTVTFDFRIYCQQNTDHFRNRCTINHFDNI